MIERPRSALEADARVAYAILFGSRGRESAHDRSDTDVAIGLVRGASLSAAEVGSLLSRLELEDLLDFCEVVGRETAGG
jgi:predicted nucleotidyltransferase